MPPHLKDLRGLQHALRRDFIPVCQPIRTQRSNKLRLLTGNMRLPRRRHRRTPGSVRPEFFFFFFGVPPEVAAPRRDGTETVLPRDKDRNSMEARGTRSSGSSRRGMVARRPELSVGGPASGLNSRDNITPVRSRHLHHH